MKELKVNKENVYLEEYDVYVKPYLTLSEKNYIYTELKDIDNYFERKIREIQLVASLCYNLEEGTEIDCGLIEASGLWEETTYILYMDLLQIDKAIEEHNSFKNVIFQVLDMVAVGLNKVAEVFPSENDVVSAVLDKMGIESDDK